eukprot:TRINITY_DN16778_c0_g1_i1.p1 TRINITY_DN16778_c0_g1~~TRINITY_DN16778_c0_g1_i1.p1  ORF type:complete len:129 (-),score=3.61 TRINITY_DN16778_c0_g1_i1:56-442(-)
MADLVLDLARRAHLGVRKHQPHELELGHSVEIVHDHVKVDHAKASDQQLAQADQRQVTRVEIPPKSRSSDVVGLEVTDVEALQATECGGKLAQTPQRHHPRRQSNPFPRRLRKARRLRRHSSPMTNEV